MINLRNALMTGGWKNPYVTDGLVAMWDGEWNVGGGVHDPNATVWKDLSGNGNDLDTLDGVSFSTKSAYVVKFAKCVNSLSSFVTFDAVLSSITRRSTIFQCGNSSHYTNPYRVIAYNSRIGRASLVDGTNAILYSDFASTPTQYTIVTSPKKSYRNGVSVADGSTNEYYYGDTFTSIGSSEIIGARCSVWRMAIYSRALTADEVAANYAIDKARFNLPDAT